MRWVEDAAETAEDSEAMVASGGDSGAGFLAEERVTHTHTHTERRGKGKKGEKERISAKLLRLLGKQPSSSSW